MQVSRRNHAWHKAMTIDRAAQLGSDLETLVQALGTQVARVTTLTSLPSLGNPRASYRFDLVDGRVVKGRRVEKSVQVDHMLQILPCLDARSFPRLLAHQGRAILEEWVNGEPLNGIEIGPETFARCGSIFAGVHTGSASTAPCTREQRADTYLDALQRRLFKLVSRGYLRRRTAAEAFDLADTFAPSAVAIDFVHGDYCADNVILTATGRPVCVDNEALSTGSCDYDLARTWYRWPMQRTAVEAFLQGYEQHRDPEGFIQHFPFWAVAVLVDSAYFRLRAETGRLEVPLDRLRELMRTVTKGRRRSNFSLLAA